MSGVVLECDVHSFWSSPMDKIQEGEQKIMDYLLEGGPLVVQAAPPLGIALYLSTSRHCPERLHLGQ